MDFKHYFIKKNITVDVMVKVDKKKNKLFDNSFMWNKDILHTMYNSFSKR